MIPLTRLDGTAIILNADHIERIEQTPDTLVALANGETLIVQESPDEIVARVVAYKRDIHHGDPARRWRVAGGAGS
ncbi:MAG: flagellar FlbD family protein [Vicinamibacterales bacterium]